MKKIEKPTEKLVKIKKQDTVVVATEPSTKELFDNLKPFDWSEKDLSDKEKLPLSIELRKVVISLKDQITNLETFINKLEFNLQLKKED